MVCSETVEFLDVLSEVAGYQALTGPGDRYHGVLVLVRALGGLDIKGSGRVDRTSEMRFDISPTISILKVWGAGVR